VRPSLQLEVVRYKCISEANRLYSCGFLPCCQCIWQYTGCFFCRFPEYGMTSIANKCDSCGAQYGDCWMLKLKWLGRSHRSLIDGRNRDFLGKTEEISETSESSRCRGRESRPAPPAHTLRCRCLNLLTTDSFWISEWYTVLNWKPAAYYFNGGRLVRLELLTLPMLEQFCNQRWTLNIK
jgi:hypothetical protein